MWYCTNYKKCSSKVRTFRDNFLTNSATFSAANKVIFREFSQKFCGIFPRKIYPSFVQNRNSPLVKMKFPFFPYLALIISLKKGKILLQKGRKWENSPTKGRNYPTKRGNYPTRKENSLQREENASRDQHPVIVPVSSRRHRDARILIRSSLQNHY